MAGQLQSRRRGLVAPSTVAGLLVVGWLAGMPWLAGHWPRVVAVGLFLVVFVGPRASSCPPGRRPRWPGSPTRRPRGRLEDERLKLQHDVRVGLLQAVAGVAVIAAVAATWQQLDTDRRQLRRQLEVAGQDTQLQGADLSGAHLSGVRASTATTWPDGFDWRAAGARLVESC
jgi:hypothetical protein